MKRVITMTKAQWILTKRVTLLQSTWYLLRAKFRNYSNFLVREIVRRRVVEERSLEMTGVLRGGGRRRWRQESSLQIFWEKKWSHLSVNKFKLATTKNKDDVRIWHASATGITIYDIMYCSFLDWFQLVGLSASDGIVPDWGGVLEN